MLKIEYFSLIKWISSLLFLSATLVYAEDSDSYYFSTAFNAGFSDFDNIKNTTPINGSARTIKDVDTTGGSSGAIGYKWQ